MKPSDGKLSNACVCSRFQGTGNHGVGFQSLRIVGPAFEYIEQRAAVFCSGHAYSICDSKKRSPHSADFHNIDSQALAEKNF